MLQVGVAYGNFTVTHYMMQRTTHIDLTKSVAEFVRCDWLHQLCLVNIYRTVCSNEIQVSTKIMALFSETLSVPSGQLRRI